MRPHLLHPAGPRQAPDNAGHRTRLPHSPAVPDFTWSSLPGPASCSSLPGQGPNTSPCSKWASPPQSCAGSQNDSSTLRSPLFSPAEQGWLPFADPQRTLDPQNASSGEKTGSDLPCATFSQGSASWRTRDVFSGPLWAPQVGKCAGSTFSSRAMSTRLGTISGCRWEHQDERRQCALSPFVSQLS